jgi:hypothetical protein
MTPKEKAKDIFDKYYQTINPTPDNNDIWIFTYTMKELAKKSSIIAVDEMLDFRNKLYMNEGSLVHEYLLEVKQELLEIQL